MPDMYENTWQVPGKLLSAVAEAAVVLATLGLFIHRKHPGIQRWLPWAAIRKRRGCNAYEAGLPGLTIGGAAATGSKP